MAIVFYDVEDWEKNYVPREIAGQEVICEPTKLTMDTAARAVDSEIISVFSWSVVDGDVLNALPKLKHIATRSTGFDHIDLEACQERHIVVSNVPAYGDRTVAEHTFALMLALSRKILHAEDRTRQKSFSREGLRGFDLEGKTLGIVGTGKIGAKVAAIASSFAMKIVALDPKPDQKLAAKYDITYVDSLAELLGQSDVISLHAPLNDSTKHLINMETIGQIKPGALLINTARGDLVQTAALLKALDDGILSGAGLDVIEHERLVGEEAEILSKSGPSNKDLAAMLHNHILLSNPKVLITPHNAFNSEEAVEKIMKTSVDNIEAFLSGQPQNVV